MNHKRSITEQYRAIMLARRYYRKAVVKAIQQGGFGEEDTGRMLAVISDNSDQSAIQTYEWSDTAVRESIQNIIEEVISDVEHSESKLIEHRCAVAVDLLGGQETLDTLPGCLKNIVNKTSDPKDKAELLEALADLKNMK